MGSKPGGKTSASALASGVEWNDILDENDHPSMVYRRKPQHHHTAKQKQSQPRPSTQREDDTHAVVRNSRRQSWICRALCNRGRKSIAFAGGNDKRRQPTKRFSSRIANKRVEAPPIQYVEEKKTYFKQVDSFELDEEDTPSPKQRPKPGYNLVPMRKLLDIVWEDPAEKTFPWIPDDEESNDSDILSRILQTPPSVLQSPTSSSDVLISSDGFSFHKVKSSKLISPKELVEDQDATVERPSPFEVSPETANTQFTFQEEKSRTSPCDVDFISEDFDNMQITDIHKSEDLTEYRVTEGKDEEGDDEPGMSAVEDPFSLLISDYEDESYELPALDKLLKICGQTRPMRLFEAFSELCDPSHVVKIGEGTFGEAFKGGGNVFKIVPVDGDFLVNGEVQKTCGDLFTEVLLSKTLNCLRCEQDKTMNNACINFVETKAIRVCEGIYDAFLVNAWEVWDENHSSENDHPMKFPEKQLYVTFILADGGQDLESFVLLDFDEARSLLMQVTSSLAVAEAACEFEHRDLHWGNILLSRAKTRSIEFILQGKRMEAQNFGLSVTIIDFTLSRINTGNQVLYLDLSADPALFEGPKRDTQAETYRRMLNVTKGNWEGRHPKTNTMWLYYVADTLLTKKAFRCSPKDKRDLQAFRKRLLMYDSAEAALSDNFFDGIWVEN